MATADQHQVVVPDQAPAKKPDDEIIVEALESYRLEADNVRKGGMNPRDDKWRENLDLYWNRYDFSDKADWQAKETMPEVPAFVDRFAAALKEALVATPDGFYTVEDPGDEEGDLTGPIKAMTDVWLTSVGRNQVGTPLDFSSVFEEQMKMGAIMACSSVVTWKEDVKGGRVAIESVDPRFVWLDHTYRNLYRVRRNVLDLHDLKGMATMKDGAGKPIFKLPEFERLISGIPEMDEAERQRITGVGNGIANTPSARCPVVLDEYIATVLNAEGDVIADRALMVVANQKYLVRGPEPIPFWHQKDWLVYAPLVTVPLSVYGRSYMEDFGSVAGTFTDLTNLIIDAVHMSAMRAYAIVPGMLLNPEQAAEGISPNKLFLLEDGVSAKDFMQALDLGSLPADVIRVWDSMKQELREAAGVNEIGMGQLAPNSRTSATEITTTQASSSAIIRSIAQTVESRYLNPTLDLVWKTGLQHVAKDNPTVMNAVDPGLASALLQRRKELIKRPIGFQARGISTLIQKGQMLKSILQIMSIVGANPLLTQEFLQQADMGKLVKLLFELSNVPMAKLQLSERERMIKSIQQPLMQAQQAAMGQPPSGGRAAPEMGSLAKSMGVARDMQ